MVCIILGVYENDGHGKLAAVACMVRQVLCVPAVYHFSNDFDSLTSIPGKCTS